VRVDAKFDPETGQCLTTALRSVTDSWARSGSEDDRTALSERPRGDLPGGSTVLTVRLWGCVPTSAVVMDLESLEGRAGRRCKLDDVGRITASAALMWNGLST
jgi:hypothetical protein